jgi:tetratricopeptide (TPR) repeat protein
MILTLPMRAQQKPFTQDQVQGLVRDGLGDESGAKLIEQRGIDFAPAEDFMRSLKAAGASEEFLKALRAAKQPEPVSAKKPLNQVQVFALLAGGVPSHRVTMLVQERGIDFEPTDDYLQEVRLAGGEDELISALKSAKVTKPVTVDPAAQARQAQVRRHVTQMAELERKGHYTEAEQECRLALSLDPQNADLQKDLTYILGQHTTARQYYSELIEHGSSLHDFVNLVGPGNFSSRSPLVCFPNDPLSLPAYSRSDTDFFIISPSTPDYLRDELGAEVSELYSQNGLETLKVVLSEISKTPPDPAFLADLSKGYNQAFRPGHRRWCFPCAPSPH